MPSSFYALSGTETPANKTVVETLTELMSSYDSQANGQVDYAETAPWSGLVGVPSTLAQTTGATFTGRLVAQASNSGGSGFRLPHGTSPDLPVNGDIWTTTTGVYARLNGTTSVLSVVGHVHDIANVTGLQTALDNKTNIGHSHVINDVTGLQTALDGKTAVGHVHAISDVTGLQTALDGKSSTGHSHSISDVTGLQTALDGKTSAAQAAASAPVQSVNGLTGAVSLDIPRQKLDNPVVTDPTTTAETVVARWAIPANFLSAGDAFLGHVGFISGSTGTVTWRLRVGAAGTTSDTAIAALTASAAQAANAYGVSQFQVRFPTLTQARGSGHAVMQAAPLGMVTGALVTATVDPTQIIYISITAQVSVASANNLITGAWGSMNS